LIGREYFYEVHEALERCGPGDDETTRQAFQLIPKLPQPPLILDIGCGPGAQTIELAKISKGRITALDSNYSGGLPRMDANEREFWPSRCLGRSTDSRPFASIRGRPEQLPWTTIRSSLTD